MADEEVLYIPPILEHEMIEGYRAIDPSTDIPHEGMEIVDEEQVIKVPIIEAWFVVELRRR